MARGLAVVVTLALALTACGDKREPHRDSPAPAQPRGVDPLASLHLPDEPIDWTKPIAKHVRDLSGYAGSAACKPCHAKEYASYERHSMARTGMRPIGSVDQAWIGKIFDAATPVTHARSGFRYTPVRHGKSFAVTETLLDANGGAIASWDEPITHVFSAGSYGLAFYSERGGRLIHLPIDYYAKAARWDLDPMAFGGNPRIGVQLDTYCISCHSDEPTQRFSDPLPPGIGCERCHGPSKQHIASLRPEDTFGPKQHPSARRQLEVCAQCHQSTFPVLREGRDHFDFRPGEQLDAMRVNFLADPAEQDRVKLLDHAERLVRSPCWRGAKDKMTCTTCHDPHTSSLEKDAAWWDSKCLQCHDRTACTDTKAHRDAAGDHCTPCHMRSGTTSNVPLVAVTDHWIQKRPPPIKPGPTQPPRSLVAWSTHLGEPVADGGASALAHADAGLTDEATRLAIAALAKTPTARLYDFVANAYLARRKTRDAGLAYRAALRLDPDDTGALFGYARVMLDGHQPAEAQHAFERMLQLDPDDVAALETLGIDRYRDGDHARAVELFQRAANTGRASGIAYVGLALDARDDETGLPRRGSAAEGKRGVEAAKQELVWLEKAWRAEPRDRWILDELDAVARVIGDPKLITEISRRRAAITPVAGSGASAWIPGQNRRQ